MYLSEQNKVGKKISQDKIVAYRNVYKTFCVISLNQIIIYTLDFSTTIDWHQNGGYGHSMEFSNFSDF